MKNSDYWKQRFIQLENEQYDFTKKKIAEIQDIFQEAYNQIEKEILAWYQRLAKNNNITMAEARKLLRKNELKEFHWTVWQYIKYGKKNELNNQWMKELENASAKIHINHLEQLEINIRQQIESAYATYENIASDTLETAYEDSYLHSAYEIQNGIGIGFNITMPDKNLVNKVLSKPWAPDGYNFSERIWKDKNKLINTVHREISIDLITGRDPQKAINNIAKIMNTSKSNAGRLVMTEEAYFSSIARGECFEKLGVKKYKIVATLDEKTSEICQSMDLKVFQMSEFQAGVTAPPFHVRCRSTTSPYFDNDYGVKGSRAARDPEIGKTYRVPDDMNYEEWKKTFVDDGDKSHLTETSEYGVKTWKRVDKSEKSDIMKMGKVKANDYIQKAPDFSKYKIAENPKAIKDTRQSIIKNFGLSEKDVNLGNLKNTEALEPLLKQFNKIQNETNFKLPNLHVVDVIDGDNLCIAGFKPMENKFYISSRYFNSMQAIEDTLKEWSSNGILPEQAKSIRYLAEHEAAHMRIPDSYANNPEIQKLHKSFLKSKNYNKNDGNIIEFLADSIAVSRISSNSVPAQMNEVAKLLEKEEKL